MYRRWNCRHQARQLLLDLIDRLDDVGAGLLENDEEHASFSIGPGRLFVVLWPRDGLTDVTDPQRAAVAIGDDDIVPVL